MCLVLSCEDGVRSLVSRLCSLLSFLYCGVFLRVFVFLGSFRFLGVWFVFVFR